MGKNCKTEIPESLISDLNTRISDNTENIELLKDKHNRLVSSTENIANSLNNTDKVITSELGRIKSTLTTVHQEILDETEQRGLALSAVDTRISRLERDKETNANSLLALENNLMTSFQERLEELNLKIIQLGTTSNTQLTECETKYKELLCSILASPCSVGSNGKGVNGSSDSDDDASSSSDILSSQQIADMIAEIERRLSEGTLDRILTGKSKEHETTIINKTNELLEQARQDTLNALAEIRTKQAELVQNTQSSVERLNTRADEINVENDRKLRDLQALVNEAERRANELNQEIRLLVRNTAEGFNQSLSLITEKDLKALQALDTYKQSNDDSVAAVVRKVDTAVETNNATASKVDSVVTKVEGLETTVQGLDGKLREVSLTAESIATEKVATATREIEGKLTTTTDKLAVLESKVTDAEGNVRSLSTALENTYTKSQADEAIAGKLNSFKAELALEGNASNEVVRANAEALEEVKTTVQQQGRDLTSLSERTNTLGSTITGKADSSVVDNINTKVTQQGNDITGLNSAVRTLTNNLGTKASTTAVEALNTKVTEQGNKLRTEAEKITRLEGSLRDAEAKFRVNDTLAGKVTGIEGDVSAQVEALRELRTDLGTKATNEAVQHLQTQTVANRERLESHGSQLVSLKGTVDNLSNKNGQLEGLLRAKADGSALSTLSNEVRVTKDKADSLQTKVTTLEGQVRGIDTAGQNRAIDALKTRVEKTESNITVHNQKIATLEGSVQSVRNGLAEKANSSALQNFYTKTETDNKVTTTVAGKLDEFKSSIKLGGSNLLNGTAKMLIGSGNWGDSTFRLSGQGLLETVNVADSPVPSVTKGIKLTVGSNAGMQVGIAQDVVPIPIGEVTLSVWVKGVRGNSIVLQPYYYGTGHNPVTKLFPLNGEWQYIHLTAPNTQYKNRMTAGYIYLRGARANNSAIIVAPMLVEGGLPSNWQPSSYDTKIDIEATARATETLRTNVTNVAGNLTTLSAKVTTLEGKVGNYNASAFETLKTEVSDIKSEAAKLTQLTSASGTNLAKLTETASTVDGLKVLKTVTVDNNGVLSGYGLTSELINGRVTSTFGINADNFFLGNPKNGRKPFIIDNGISILNNAVIKDASIGSAKIANLAVNSGHINNLAVNNGHIANLAVNTAKIADLSITNAKIANAAIDKAKIANAAIETAHIKEGAITNAHIVNGTIDGAKIKDATIDVGKIKNLTVGMAQIRDLQVTNLQLAGQAVTWDKIANNTIKEANIAPKAITGSSIADRAITGTNLVPKTITNNLIADKTITNSQLADSTITGSKIVNSTITNTQIAQSTITGAKIANSTITGINILDGTITMAKISEHLQSDNYVAGRSGWKLSKNGGLEINGSLGDGTRIQLTHRGLVGYYANGKKAFELGIFE